jgi:RNA polymerase sigma-70 factor (ECF subfamily)
MADAPVAPRKFATTRWSLVLAAGRQRTPQSREALGRLCELYWYPLYAFVRRKGHSPEDAHDLTQAFFANLLEKNGLATVDPARGRFRAWLRVAMDHHLANARDHERALKRGGGQVALRIDVAEAEGRYRLEPSHDETPERIYERRWALQLLEHALAALGEECVRKGNGALFDMLRGTLVEGGEGYARFAEPLAMTPGAVKVAAHRLRRRFRELLRARIADTVENLEDLDDELWHLFAALS